jgi:hypothetical protein
VTGHVGRDRPGIAQEGEPGKTPEQSCPRSDRGRSIIVENAVLRT